MDIDYNITEHDFDYNITEHHFDCNITEHHFDCNITEHHFDYNITEHDLFKDHDDFLTDLSNKSTQVRPFLLTSDAKNDYSAIIACFG